MNNIYVETKPKNCSECQFCDKDNGLCEILGQYFRDGYDYSDCPLNPLSDALAEERMKVVQEIRDLVGDYWTIPLEKVIDYDGKEISAFITSNDLTEILDKIERGTDETN